MFRVLYITNKKLSQFIFFTVNIFCSYFNSPSSKSSARFTELPLDCLVLRSCLGSSFIQEKGKLAEMTTRCHSLSLFVIRCHSLSFVVTCCTTCCHSWYHSLSFVVTRWITRLSFFKQSSFPL